MGGIQIFPVIVIAGPTASGKTRISVEAARELGGEIVSADSMQVYRYMNIGTAKPDQAEMSGIPHHLIDVADPGEEFSVVRYQELALEAIDAIQSRGKVPIVAGGTGLYINSLVYNIRFSETTSDWSLREELQREAQEKGNEFLHRKLAELDPEAAKNIHYNNVKRVIRAIEVCTQTQKPISSHLEASRMNPPRYRFFVFGLAMNRERLYERIEKRVDLMLENGLIQEVRHLEELGYGNSMIAMQGLGYKEILAYLRGEVTLEEAIYILKRDTRRYAKRQLTWFKRLEGIHWIDLDTCSDDKAVVKIIKEHIASSGIIL